MTTQLDLRRLSTPTLRNVMVAALPGLVLAGGMLHLYVTVDPTAFETVDLGSHRATAPRPVHGYRTVTTFFILALVSVGCVATAYSQLARRRSWRRLLTAVSAGVATSGCLWFAETIRPLHSRLGHSIYPTLLGEAVERMEAYVGLGNAVASMAIWAIVMAGNDLLRKSDNAQTTKVVDDVRALLMAASALCVAGVVFMRAWMSWPLAHLQMDSALATAFAEVIAWATGYAGIVFATMLAVYFIALVLELENWGHPRLLGMLGRRTLFWALSAPVTVQVAVEVLGMLGLPRMEALAP